MWILHGACWCSCSPRFILGFFIYFVSSCMCICMVAWLICRVFHCISFPSTLLAFNHPTRQTLQPFQLPLPHPLPNYARPRQLHPANAHWHVPSVPLNSSTVNFHPFSPFNSQRLKSSPLHQLPPPPPSNLGPLRPALTMYTPPSSIIASLHCQSTLPPHLFPFRLLT